MQFIKIPNSWLFHINIIYTSKYNVENLETKLHFISLFFYITKNSHNNMNMKISEKVCTFLCYWELQLKKYSEKSHVLLKWNQTTKLNLWYLKKIEYVVFFTNYLLYHYFKIVSKNENPFPKIPILGKSPNHHQHDSKLNNNSKFKPQMSNDQSLSLMPCSSKIM